jgi:hypothetical protein
MMADLAAAPVQPWDALVCTSYAVASALEQVLGVLASQHYRDDYFVHHLLGVEPPDWNRVSLPAEPTETVLATSATEPAPIATALSAASKTRRRPVPLARPCGFRGP